MFDKVTFNIVKPLGVFAEYTDYRGETKTKEVNLVSWNGKAPKLDIREWNADHTTMTKGLTLTDAEAETLVMILHNYVAERR